MFDQSANRNNIEGFSLVAKKENYGRKRYFVQKAKYITLETMVFTGGITP